MDDEWISLSHSFNEHFRMTVTTHLVTKKKQCFVSSRGLWSSVGK